MLVDCTAGAARWMFSKAQHIRRVTGLSFPTFSPLEALPFAVHAPTYKGGPLEIPFHIALSVPATRSSRRARLISGVAVRHDTFVHLAGPEKVPFQQLCTCLELPPWVCAHLMPRMWPSGTP